MHHAALVKMGSKPPHTRHLQMPHKSPRKAAVHPLDDPGTARTRSYLRNRPLHPQSL